MKSILDLDDDSLQNIFQFLSVYELIEVESVCEEFKSICQDVYRSKRFQKLRLELRHLRCKQFKDIFVRIGDTLRVFEFSGGYIMDESVMKDLIDGVTRSCSRLTSLSLNYVTLTEEIFKELQVGFNKLTSLDLSRCSIHESSIGFTLDGERFKSIRELKLAGNSCMTGSFFAGMEHIEVLDISFCFNLSYFEFLKFLTNCRHLRELNISASCQLVSEDENFLRVLLDHQPDLEKLVMDNTGVTRSDDEVMSVLSQFKKLKYSSFEGRKFGT